MKAWKRIQEDKRHHRIELLEIVKFQSVVIQSGYCASMAVTLTRDYPALAQMVGGMDKHSFSLMNRMRASLT